MQREEVVKDCEEVLSTDMRDHLYAVAHYGEVSDLLFALTVLDVLMRKSDIEEPLGFLQEKGHFQGLHINWTTG